MHVHVLAGHLLTVYPHWPMFGGNDPEVFDICIAALSCCRSILIREIQSEKLQSRLRAQRS